MRYEILDGQVVVDVIMADSAYMAEHYPLGNYREAPIFPSQRETILAQLAAIDAATNKPRTIREVQLGNAATLTWLATQDAAAAALRAQLALLP